MAVKDFIKRHFGIEVNDEEFDIKVEKEKLEEFVKDFDFELVDVMDDGSDVTVVYSGKGEEGVNLSILIWTGVKEVKKGNICNFVVRVVDEDDPDFMYEFYC